MSDIDPRDDEKLAYKYGLDKKSSYWYENDFITNGVGQTMVRAVYVTDWIVMPDGG